MTPEEYEQMERDAIREVLASPEFVPVASEGTKDILGRSIIKTVFPDDESHIIRGEG